MSSTAISYKKSATLVPGKGNPTLKVEAFDSKKIQLYTIDQFLSPGECEQIIEQSTPHFEFSNVTHYSEDLGFRTSETCHLDFLNTPIGNSIDLKIAHCLGLRLPYSERIQVQKYEVEQEFKAHYDCFPQHKLDASGQRTWTFMVYLTDVEAGGGTRFANLDLTIEPKMGRAVVWNNLLKTGVQNNYTLHAGLPVEKGTKIIITKWFRDRGEGKAWF